MGKETPSRKRPRRVRSHAAGPANGERPERRSSPATGSRKQAAQEKRGTNVSKKARRREEKKKRASGVTRGSRSSGSFASSCACGECIRTGVGTSDAAAGAAAPPTAGSKPARPSTTASRTRRQREGGLPPGMLGLGRGGQTNTASTGRLADRSRRRGPCNQRVSPLESARSGSRSRHRFSIRGA